MQSNTIFNVQACDEHVHNENNTKLSDHICINNTVDGNAKQQNVQCHKDYALLQYNAKLATLLQG